MEIQLILNDEIAASQGSGFLITSHRSSLPANSLPGIHWRLDLAVLGIGVWSCPRNPLYCSKYSGTCRPERRRDHEHHRPLDLLLTT